MSLPNADRAFVEPGKTRDYLLAAGHPVGRFKAQFFVSLGYAADQWERLRDDILAIAQSGSIVGDTGILYGRKFRGRWYPDCTIWAIGCGEDCVDHPHGRGLSTVGDRLPEVNHVQPS